MNASAILAAARSTLAGDTLFPDIVRQLIAAGVEYYHVDYAGLRTTFYSGDGCVVVTPIPWDDLPAIANDFDARSVRAAIFDSQQNGQTYRDFTRRVMVAGVQAYFAFLRGQRVTYFGRQGDQHTEWFPGAQPTPPTDTR